MSEATAPARPGGPRVIHARLTARPPKAVEDAGGLVVAWRGHAVDDRGHKLVFIATAVQGEAIVPLMAGGGGQEVVLLGMGSSTMSHLASAADPVLAEAVEGGAREDVRAALETTR